MENPLQLCSDLKSIFRRQAGCWLDCDTLHRVRGLCVAVEQAAQDEHCLAEIGRVARYAERLHSHCDPRTDLLREQILLALDSIQDRLYT